MNRPLDRRAVLRSAGLFGLLGLVGGGSVLAACASEPEVGTSAKRVRVDGDVDRALLDAIDAEAQTAARSVIDFWGPGAVWRGGAPARVRVFTDHAGFVAAGGDPNESAVTATTTQDSVVLVAPQLARAASGARVFVLTHELTHVRLGVRSAAQHWVAEGAAELTALDASGMTLSTYAPTLVARVKSGQVPGGPADDGELSATASDLRGAYQRACAYSRFLLARSGAAHYRAWVEAALAGATSPDFSGTFGGSQQSLSAAFRQWLTGQVDAGK